MNEDLKQLRKKIDGNDPFMSHGYQIKKIRAREKVVPSWTNSDKEIQKLLNAVFPKWRKNPLQHKRAARWAAVIILFYRVGMSKSKIAAELKTKTSTINLVLQRIKRVAKGQRGDNRQPLRLRPPGRPRKSS